MKPLRLALVSALLPAWGLCAESRKPPPEPKLTSLYPLSVPQGRTTAVQIRGTALGGARGVLMTQPGVTARVVKLEPGDPADLLHAEFTVDSGATTGSHPLRLVASGGVTNEISLLVVDRPTVVEEQAGTVGAPQVINGRLSARGEMDQFWIEAKAGQTMTFEARSGFAGFDTALGLAEPSGSWFDAARLNRVAFNDEPLHFPGLNNEARLVHQIGRAHV